MCVSQPHLTIHSMLRLNFGIHIELHHAHVCVVKVLDESFWRMEEGPNQWAATLRWLCFSDTTLELAVKEANRVFRQLSLGGFAAVQAAQIVACEVR